MKTGKPCAAVGITCGPRPFQRRVLAAARVGCLALQLNCLEAGLCDVQLVLLQVQLKGRLRCQQLLRLYVALQNVWDLPSNMHGRSSIFQYHTSCNGMINNGQQLGP